MDRKISNFLGQAALPSGSFLTYIYQDTNYKILDTDFYGSLGVTGTIEQVGDPTSTPVLDKAGSVNGIRNLESGSGVKALVSPSNGVLLEHGFTEDTSGVTLVEDLSALNPNFRSLVAGSGLNVGSDNGTIQIALSETPASTKTIVVDDISDFPTAVSGVITLADDTEYLLRNDITTSDRFVLGNNTIINDTSSLLITLTYTGSGSMFTAANTSFVIRNLNLTCATGTLLTYTGNGTGLIQIIECTVVCNILGSISDFLGMNINSTRFSMTSDGLSFGGTNGLLLSQTNLSILDAGTVYDLGSATFDGFAVLTSFITLNGSSTFMDGLIDSGNITANNLGSITNCRFFGTGTPLNNIDANDLQWAMGLNDAIDTTDRFGLTSLSGNATVTTIDTTGVPVKLAGTWADMGSSQFTADATGRITYNGLQALNSDIAATVSGSPVSGNNKMMVFYLAINGVVDVDTAIPNVASSGAIDNTTLIWHEKLNTDDFIEVFVSNDSDTSNILVTDAKMKAS